MTEESALLKRARTYDPEVLGELYDRYAPKMYAYIYRRVGDSSLAEELTGDLFVRVLAALRNDQAWRHSPVPWLYQIAHNLVVDHYRREPPLPVLSLDESLVPHATNPATAAEQALAQDRLRAAIKRLTADQQEVLALRFGEGFTLAETAKILGKSAGAVQALQHRAVAALRRILIGEEA